ncbi:MAG: hypothetical protein ACREMY_31565, partial [bacterium]
LEKISRFDNSLVTRFDGARLGILEVEQGVLDGWAKRFWFTGYATENLWCFSLETGQLATCELRYPRSEVVAIACQGEQASILVKHRSFFRIQKYKQVSSQLVCDIQVEAPSHDTLWREVSEKLNEPSAELRGRSGDKIVLTTETSALLAAL